MINSEISGSFNLIRMRNSNLILKPYTIKKINILYRIFTGLFAALMLMSAISDILLVDMAVKGFGEMGMPAYLIPFFRNC